MDAYYLILLGAGIVSAICIWAEFRAEDKIAQFERTRANYGRKV